MEKKNSKWILLWLFVLVFGFQFIVTHNDRAILPEQQVEKIIEEPGSGPIGGNQVFHIRKMVTQRNPWDYVILYGLLLIILIAYWQLLSYLVASSGLRLLIFIISLPVGYVVLLSTTLLVNFR